MSKEAELVKKIADNIDKVVIGKTEEIFNILKGVIAGGHILIEDVPGVGKTTLVKALAKSLDLSCNRIQFTPDLLPSDITGISIYNPKSLEFEFKKGPVFSNIVLADEINRTSPKTQSALLEVMEERQVSEGNSTYRLQEPFLVLATENPIEHEGTFILPESQLDRFMIKVKIGYPTKDFEMKILNIYKNSEPLQEIESVADANEILNLQRSVKEIRTTAEINQYIVDIINSTRKNSYLSLGASTRASLALLRISQAAALIGSRDYVIPEDVKESASLVLSHRVILSSLARANNYNGESVINLILKNVPVPRVR